MKLFVKEANKEIDLDPEFVASLADHVKDGQTSVLVDLDPVVHGVHRAEIPVTKIAEAEFGGQMATSFKDELEKLSVSPGYLARRVVARGLSTGTPAGVIKATARKAETMQKLRQAGFGARTEEMRRAVSRGLKEKPKLPQVPKKKPMGHGRQVAMGAGAAAVPALLYARYRQRQEKAAAAGDIQPASGYGLGEDGAPGLKEQVMGTQMSLERKAEDARQVGEPRSDHLQKVLQRLQGTSGEEEVKVRALQQKAAQAKTIPITREDVMAASGKARRSRALAGVAGTAGGAALGTLLRPRAAGAALGSLGGLVAGSGIGSRMAGGSFRKELMRRAKARQEKTSAEKRRGRALPAGVATGAGVGALTETLRRRRELKGILSAPGAIGPGMLPPTLSKALGREGLARAKRGRLAGSIAAGGLAGGLLGKAISKLKGRTKTSSALAAGDTVRFAYGPAQKIHMGTVVKVGSVPYRGVGPAASVQFHDSPAGYPTALPLRILEKTSAVSRVGYSPYFKNKMHERGITSPTQLSVKGKKQFFEGVDKGWKSKMEALHRGGADIHK